MIRISTIFIAICMVLVAASLGLVLYSVAGISGTESAIGALTALTFLILYNAVSMRLRDRSDVGGQIADLSRGTADLARQVAEFGRRLAAVEGRIASSNSTNSDRIQSVVGEINELGGLVRQLAATVSAHEDLLADGTPAPAPAPLAKPELEGPIDLIAMRDERDQLIAAEEFISIAEASGLIGRVDNMVMLRCVQVLRRLMVRNKDVGVFCNVAASTLGNSTTFAQCLDFLEANRALAPSLVLEFKQATFRNLGPTEPEHLAALSQRGYRFSMDHVTDLRVEPRELADRGVRFIKVPAALLLDPRQTSASDIHPSDLSDLLGRFGIDLIAEKIEGERAVVDLLDYDVRFGQGFLFAPPRPLRPEGASATGGSAPNKAQETNGSGKTASLDSPAIDPLRASGNAALARRAAGPPG